MHDVSTHIKDGYCSGLLLLSETQTNLGADYLDILAEIFAYQPLVLGETDYTNTINQKILRILSSESTKSTVFPDEIFRIFDHIFTNASTEYQQTLQIIRNYVERNQKLPEETIFSLEKALDVQEQSQICLEIFEKIIFNGQAVSERVLKEFGDHIYYSLDSRRKDKSFEVLNKAYDNQDISPEIFRIVEVERASRNILSNSESEVINELNFLENLSESGQKVPGSTFEAILALLKKKPNPYFVKLVSILTKVAENKCKIQESIVDEIHFGYGEEINNSALLNLFDLMIRNHQILPMAVNVKLISVVGNDEDSKLILSILHSQKDVKIPANAINLILDKFSQQTEESFKKAYILAISTIISSNSEANFDKQLCCDYFAKSLSMEDHDILSVIRHGFRNLNYFTEYSVESLVELATRCDKEIHKEITELLNKCTLSKELKTKLLLTTLTDRPDEEFLKAILKLKDSKPNLLPQNFKRIIQILSQNSAQQFDALKVLHTIGNKQDIPEEIFTKILASLNSTSEEKLQQRYITFFQKMVLDKVKFSNQTLSALAQQMFRLKSENVQKLLTLFEQISEYQTICPEIIEKTKLFNHKWTESDPNILDNLTKIKAEILSGTELIEDRVKELTKLSKKLTCQKSRAVLADIFSLLVLNDQNINDISTLTSLVEDALLYNNSTTSIVKCYQKILRENKTRNVKQVIDSLSKFTKECDPPLKHRLSILEILVDAAKLKKITKQGFNSLETHLTSDNPALRSLFRRP